MFLHWETDQKLRLLHKLLTIASIYKETFDILWPEKLAKYFTKKSAITID